MQSIEERIAKDIAAQPAQVHAAVALLDEGATVPFIARYRKEVTGALDDSQLRSLEEQLNAIVGVVCNGLFAARPADVLLLGSKDGVQRIVKG